MEKLINHRFFDLEKSKNTLITEKEIKKEISRLYNVNYTSIKGLIYQEHNTIRFKKIPRVYYFIKGNLKYKVRYCPTTNDAIDIFLKSVFASNNKLPVSKPIRLTKNYILYKYTDGDNIDIINKNTVKKIAKLHSKINNIQYDNANCKKILETKLKYCIKKWILYLKNNKFDLIYENKIDDKLKSIPPIIPCFDHQDFGVHNLIINKKKIYIIDEEAFGILPLGYSMIRPIFDRNKYRIIKQKKVFDYTKYFKFENSKYFIDNLPFFRSLFILRNTVRRHIVGNIVGSLRLIKEIEKI